MANVFAVIFCIGAAAFTAWSVIKLIGAIKERKAHKSADASEDKGKEESK